MPGQVTRGAAFASWLERLLGPVLALWMVAGTLVADDVDQPLGTLCAAAAGLALLVRRQLGLAAFLVAMAGLQTLQCAAPDFVDESPAFILTFLVATYSLGRWSEGRERWAGLVCVAGSTVAFVVSDMASRGDLRWPISVADALFAAFVCAGPWLAGVAIGTLAHRNRRLHVEQEEVAERAVAEERARIARELHDVVSHAISVTVLQARGARRSLEDDPAAVREALDAIEHTNTQALSDMRRLLAVLRDTEADTGTPTAPQPSLARLDDLLAQVRDSGVPVRVTACGGPRDIPPGVDLSAYRIVQESLTNVLRHAAGAAAEVALEYGDQALVVTVTNGPSPSPNGQPGSGHGLIGVQERVAVVGGDVTAARTDDGGYRVRARLPYSLEAP